MAEKKRRLSRLLSSRHCWVERLEERYLLTGTPLETWPLMEYNVPAGAWPRAEAQPATVAGASSVPVASFQQQDTFLLHSLPGATKVIYLDFTGNLTVGTNWNTDFKTPNILTPAFDVDGTPQTFDGEWQIIQNTWEQVSELFRPFDVDVTTQDPGVDALRNTFATDNIDDQWGVRVLIGGSVFDWYAPNGGSTSSVGVAYVGSFTADSDVPAFVFSDQIGADPRALTLVIAHETGHTLGLAHDGQFRSFLNISASPPAFVTRTDDYFAGHALTDDTSPFDPIGNVNWSPLTSWGPIMGNGSAGLMQWSKGEYFNANNTQDDLSVITSQNGFGYRTDDHGSATTSADPLAAEAQNDGSETLSGDGIIEQNTDQDFFSFTIDGLGEIVDLDVHPFYNGANMDILAKIYDSLGHIIATSNPLTDIAAGSATFLDTFYSASNAGTQILDGGWLVQLDSSAPNPSFADPATGDVYGVVSLNPTVNGIWTAVSKLLLQPGTYYLSVEGTGKALTYLDMTDEPWLEAQADPLLSTKHVNPLPDSSIHPGPIKRFVDNNRTGYYIEDPDDEFMPIPLPDDNSDYGYSNYGSLGSYTITGTRKAGLLVGVDFDTDTGASPNNWNSFTGSPDSTVTKKNLVSELGLPVPYQLTVSTTGASLTTSGDNGIDPSQLPVHPIALDDLDGFLSADDQSLSFTWSNLAPSTVYEVYVFGHADVDVENTITVTGGIWNGVTQVDTFTQNVSADGLIVNDNDPGNQVLGTLALYITSDISGQIKIDVTNPLGGEVAIAGLAITTTKVGTISGTKWDDENGDRIFDPGEDKLEGWTIYLDLNNNGHLDSTTSASQTLTQASSDIPQAIPDQNIVGVKSTLDFTGVGIIEDVNVTLDITHTYDSDVHATLISPLGTRVRLFTNVGANGDNFHNTVLDDSGLIPIGTQQAPFTGTFRPEQPLSILNGEEASGQWKLELIDDAVGDTGVLNSWSLSIKIQGVTTFLEPHEVTNAAGRYTFDSLPPGLYNVREDISPEQVAAGWRQTWAPAPLTLRSGADLQDIDIGNWIPTSQKGSISGQKYYDSNQNGVEDVGDPGLPGWIVYIDSNHNGVRDATSTPTQIQSSDVPKPITDLHTTNSQINVASIGTIFNVEVTLDITHSFVADLDVFLVSPSGRKVELFTGVGGQYNDFHNLTLSDSASRSISTIGFNDLPYSGTWKPEGTLSDFGGEDSAGIWTLVVTDNDAFDEGTLNSWSLSLTSGELFRTTDDQGNYEFDNLAPGAYTVREEPRSGWVQIPPADTEIPAAIWNAAGWDVTVAGLDDINDPDGPDSHRNVKNVNFGNHSTPSGLGDYNSNQSTDAGDYVLWRKTRGSSVSPATGADGNGNGAIDDADYNVWRSNFGQAVGSGSDAAAASLAFDTDSFATPFNGPSSRSVSLLSATGGGLAMESDGGSTTAPNLQSPSSAGSSLSLFGFVVAPQSTSLGSTDVSARSLSQQAAEPSEQNDLALLAWLSNSSTSSSAIASAQDSPMSHDSDEPDAVDVAFELLEGNALALATI